MANKKRDRNAYRKKLGRYKLSRKNVLDLEKILWVYADAREMQHANISKMPDGRKHMPRRAVDRRIKVGRYIPFHLTFGWGEMGIHNAGVDWIYSEDSVKFISSYIKKARYVEVAAWPGIVITFTPLSTTIYAQTHYATGRELKAMREAVATIENYIGASVTRSLINRINLSE